MRRLIPIFAAMIFASSASAQVQTKPAAPNVSDHVAVDTRPAREQSTKAEVSAPATPQNTAAQNNPSYTIFAHESIYRAWQECFKDCSP